MNNKIKNYLVIIAYIILTTGLLVCSIEDIENPWNTMFFSFAIILIFTIRQIIGEGQRKKLYILYVLVQTALIFMLGQIDNGTSFVLFYFVIIYDVIFRVYGIYSLFYSGMLYALTFYINYCKFKGIGIVTVYKLEFYNFVIYFFVVTILYLLKYICNINNKLEAAKDGLSIKNIELEASFEKIREAYRKNEDYIVMDTKNRLAREIHDTVGHTLTTALVEMEASKVLMEEDKKEASNKLTSALEQVRKGLRQVRTSVRALDKSQINYYNEVIELIKNTILHTNVIIRYDIDDFNGEKEIVKRCIFRALQEGISNGIRHGAATAFLFKLKYDKELLRFSLENNGKGLSNFKKGFGLTAMEERVKEANGSLDIFTDIDEGFNIYINFEVDKSLEN
ncbi:sensor histidine kinase [Clostridium neuense]|uniref:histidine kinase n=1 Tax=Clostridium neuense TaxID=1728934 RepID=A0ABW8TCQ8_9CLOT